MKTIYLKFAGKCADCGSHLPVGTPAKYYGRGRVYGLECHPKPSKAVRAARRAYGFNPSSVVTGEQEPKPYPCEDAPCCGCCGPGTDDPAYAIEEPYDVWDDPCFDDRY